MSMIGAVMARNGATACSPAAPPPACTMNAMMTSFPWCSAGTNGIGGAGMMLAIVERSSGAAAARTRAERTLVLIGSIGLGFAFKLYTPLDRPGALKQQFALARVTRKRGCAFELRAGFVKATQFR